MLFSFLEARENPFFPATTQDEMPYTTNNQQAFTPLQQATISLPTHARVIKKVTIQYQSLDGSIKTKSLNLNNSVDWHNPIVISQQNTQKIKAQIIKQPIKKERFKKLFSFKYASFFTKANSIKIITDDKLIRNFLLVNPHRIVIDFKRDANFRSYFKENKNTIFKKIRVGNHNGYYRVVIELDGEYKLKRQKINNGYIFNLS